MSVSTRFAVKNWSYERFTDSRIPSLILFYAIQLIVFFGVYTAVLAVRRSALVVAVVSMLLALAGLARGLSRGATADTIERQSHHESTTADAAATVTSPIEKFAWSLVRLTALDVYGNSLLSRRASSYLSSVAVLLLVTSLFQFVAFAYLSYQPLIDIVVPPVAAILSLLLALLLTTSLAISERALLTTELSWHVCLTYVLHLTVAGVIAAIMTTAMMLRLADSAVTQQVITDRIEARLIAEVLRRGKPEAQLSEQDIAELRSVAIAVRNTNQKPTFIEKLQALHELRDPSAHITAVEHSAEVPAVLTKAGVVSPPATLGSPVLGRLHWCLFALFWLFPSINMVARLMAPRDVNFYLSLKKQARYIGYGWEEAVAEDGRETNLPVTVSAA